MDNREDRVVELFGANRIIFPFFSLLIVLSIVYPENILLYPTFIDWRTVAVLTGLFIITTGVKESSYLLNRAKKIVIKVNSERELALILIVLTSTMAMFLTNDVALLIVIPLTMAFQSALQNDLQKLVVFETISANAGASLTPIGNPQNLFLWHQ